MAPLAPEQVRLLIVGTPRSGTTLVQRLACELAGVAIPYETHFFTKGVEMLRAEGALPLSGAVLRRGLTTYAALPHLEGADLEVDAVLARVPETPTLLELFDAVVGVLAGPAEVLGEKTPGHLHWAGVLARARPELRVVAVVRDPRAVVASQMQTPWGGTHVDLIAQRWVDDQRTIVDLRESLGDALLLLRYEDVVSSPSAARSAIAATLSRGEPGPVQTLARAPMQLPREVWKEPVDAPITTGRVDAWSQTLGRLDADRVAAICADDLDRFGYGAARLRPLRGAWVRTTMPLDSRRRAQRFRQRRNLLRARIAATDVAAPAGRAPETR